MPIYEYRCAECGHQLDVLQKINDAPLRKCPECGKSKLKRLMSAPSFRLKGSGWYETDFKSDGEKKRNLVESGDRAAAKPEAAVEAAAKSTEAKAASPADAKPAASPNGGSAEKKQPAAAKPAAATPRKKTSTKADKSARA